ncbi:hypothetical protein B484DRAFT_462348, partial [Ochromonadaceae sp. CCMP2298]
MIGTSDRAVSVTYATADGTALNPADYGSTSAQLVWSPLDPVKIKTAPVVITNDAVREDEESFFLVLSLPTGGAQIAGGLGRVTIQDNDASFLRALTATRLESALSTDAIRVELVGASDKPVSVSFATSSLTATDGADFTGVSGTLSWSAGAQGVQTASVTILQDTVTEGSELFTFALSGETVNIPVQARVGNVTILDDDVLQLTIADQSFGEAAGVANAIMVTLTGTSDEPVVVDYETVSGSAVAGSDFVATSGRLTWAPTATGSQVRTITIVNDAVKEATEDFRVLLRNVTAGVTVIRDEATIQIVDNDSVDLAVTSSSALSESAGNVIAFTVTMTGTSTQPVSVSFSTVDGTAA